MKANKIFYLAIILLVVGFGCNPLEDSINEFHEDLNEDGNALVTLEYTLTSADYKALAKVLKESGDEQNIARAAVVESNNVVFAGIDMSDFLEGIVTSKYPQWGNKTTALVSYNYTESTDPIVAEDLSIYTEATIITLSAADYESVGLEKSGFFFPSNPASDHLGDLVSSKIQDALTDDIIAVSYMMSSEDTVYDYSSIETKTVISEGFDTNISGVSTFNLLGTLAWKYGTFSGDGYASCSSYSGGSNFANEDWMVSPEIDLADLSAVELSFRQATYITVAHPNVTDVVSIHVSTDFDGTNVETANWVDVSSKVDAWPTKTGSNGYSATITSVADLSDFDGEKIYIGFRFKMTDEQVVAGNSVTWQVYNVAVTGVSGEPALSSKAPIAHTSYYQYSGSAWTEMTDVYALTADDYNAMGETSGLPGRYDNFSSTALPSSYLPTYLSNKYTYAQEGDENILVYKYFTGSATETRADKYTLVSGEWMANYVEGLSVSVKTDQLKKNSSGWAFDPSVDLSMVSADYQIIVNYVKANITNPVVDGKEIPLVDSYGTAEFYYGASAFYNNFDIRSSNRVSGGRYQQPEYFDLSEEEIQTLIISRMEEGISVLLSNKYSAAVPVEGIEVTYKVTCAAYNGSSTDTWVTEYIVTGPGQFELVDGPTKQ